MINRIIAGIALILLAGAMFHLGMFYMAVKCSYTFSTYSVIGVENLFGFEYVVCYW